MVLVRDTLRTNLLVLLGWLGLMTLAVLAWSLAVAVSNHLTLRDDLRKAHEVDALIRLSHALRTEDDAVSRTLRGMVAAPSPDAAAALTDAAFASVYSHLSWHQGGAQDVALTDLEILQDGLRERRAAVRQALGPAGTHRGPVLRRWRAFVDAAAPRVDAIGHDLIREADTSSSPVARTLSLRHYALATFGALADNRFAIEELIADPSGMRIDHRRVTLASARLAGAAHLARDLFAAGEVAAYRQVAMSTDLVLGAYLGAEARLLDDLATGMAKPEGLAEWRAASLRAAAGFVLAEEALANHTDVALQDAWKRGLAAMALWTVALLSAAALLASAARIALHRIIMPLEDIQSRMHRLAQGDLSVEVGNGPSLAEIRAMHDALALFKESGLRLERMQVELAQPNDAGGLPATR